MKVMPIDMIMMIGVLMPAVLVPVWMRVRFLLEPSLNVWGLGGGVEKPCVEQGLRLDSAVFRNQLGGTGV